MASEKCIAHPKVQDMLGEPIKAFGEETRRGRRRHVGSVYSPTKLLVYSGRENLKAAWTEFSTVG